MGSLVDRASVTLVIRGQAEAVEVKPTYVVTLFDEPAIGL